MSNTKPRFTAWLAHEFISIVDNWSGDKTYIQTCQTEEGDNIVLLRNFDSTEEKEFSLDDALKVFVKRKFYADSDENAARNLFKEFETYMKTKIPDTQIYSEVKWYVKSPNCKRMEFETEAAARQFAAELAETSRILDIQKEVKGRFSEATIRAILAAAEKLKN